MNKKTIDRYRKLSKWRNQFKSNSSSENAVKLYVIHDLCFNDTDINIKIKVSGLNRHIDRMNRIASMRVKK